jgi:hypothetical protein
MSVKVPSDIEVADRLLWDLTARQVAILGITALCGFSIYLGLGRAPAVVVSALEVIVVGIGAAFAIARPDGVAAERWVLAAARHLRTPTRRVAAPEGLPKLPKWAQDKPVSELNFPVEEVEEGGVLTLDRNEFALVCRCSALNLALRSEEEQQALLDGFGRFLNSIDAGLSFVVRSERSDVRDHIRALDQRAGALPHPALEEAARSHASYLASLAERKDVLRREVYLVLKTSAGNREEGARRLSARAEAAAALLRTIGISLAMLEDDAALSLIARACKPSDSLPLDGQALPAPRSRGRWREIAQARWAQTAPRHPRLGAGPGLARGVATAHQNRRHLVRIVRGDGLSPPSGPRLAPAAHVLSGAGPAAARRGARTRARRR